MQNKDMDALIIIAEASAVIILAGAAYIMSLKDKLSLEKLKNKGINFFIKNLFFFNLKIN